MAWEWPVPESTLWSIPESGLPGKEKEGDTWAGQRRRGWWTGTESIWAHTGQGKWWQLVHRTISGKQKEKCRIPPFLGGLFTCAK